MIFVVSAMLFFVCLLLLFWGEGVWGGGGGGAHDAWYSISVMPYVCMLKGCHTGL